MKLDGMKKPPLQMEYYYYPEIKLVTRQGIPIDQVKPEQVGYEFDVEPQAYQSEDDQLCYKVDLRIRTRDLKGKTNPYELDLLVSGYFRLDEQIPAEKQGGIARVLGANILYGAAREFLFQLTSRGPFPSIWLPTTSFVPDLPAVPAQAPERPLPSAPKAKVSRRKS